MIAPLTGQGVAVVKENVNITKALKNLWFIIRVHWTNLTLD